MDDVAIGRAVRALRQRRGWRQVDLAHKAGVSASLLGLVERGQAQRLSVHALRSVCTALGIRLEWDVGYRRAELAQLRDARHAALAEMVMRMLERLGWMVAPEVSFNHYGERGRIDLLAFEPRTRTLLVVELKTVLVDLQDLIGSLHVKERVARRVASELGWSAAAVVPAVFLIATSTNRRRVLEHDRLLARFALRGRAARNWLQSPAGTPSGMPSGLLVMPYLPDRNRIAVKRIRRPRSSTQASPPSVATVAPRSARRTGSV